MKKLLLFSTLILFTNNFATAQFGLSAKYQMNSHSGWDEAFDGEKNIMPSSIEFGLNYWFRLKNKRVEFLPELTYATASSDYSDTGFAVELSQSKRTSYGIGINTHVYPLDFAGDCDCPTFSKDGNLVSKGFHWIVNTSIISHSIENMFYAPINGAREPSIIVEGDKQISFRAGLGAGLDIGITELITVVPYALYTRNFGVKAPNLTTIEPSPMSGDPISSSMDQLQFGLRLVLRPDYLKKNGGFRRR